MGRYRTCDAYMKNLNESYFLCLHLNTKSSNYLLKNLVTCSILPSNLCSAKWSWFDMNLNIIKVTMEFRIETSPYLSKKILNNFFKSSYLRYTKMICVSIFFVLNILIKIGKRKSLVIQSARIRCCKFTSSNISLLICTLER